MRQPLERNSIDADRIGQARLAAILAVSKIGRPIPEDEQQVYKRLAGPSPLSVVCPHCRAGIGQRCYIPGTRQPFRGHHPSRIDAAGAPAPPPPRPALAPQPPVRRAAPAIADAVCGTNELLTDEQTSRGVCGPCWPTVAGQTTDRNGQTA